MSWTFLGIIDGSDDDPALYPVLSERGSVRPVALDVEDGQRTMFFNATRVTIDQRNSTLPPVTLQDHRELNFCAIITDERLIVYCEKFDKGGGWLGFGDGAAVLALGANTVSKVRAASRRRGKLLAGQVRYSWLSSVVALPKVEWGTSEKLRLVVATHQNPSRALQITLSLPKQVNADSVATEIVRRAARQRLNHVDIPREMRAAVQALATGRDRSQTQSSDQTQRPFGEYELPLPCVVASHIGGQIGNAQGSLEGRAE